MEIMLEEIGMDVVEKIKAIRKKLNMSQKEFAQKIGMSRSNYANLEQRRVTPTPRLINYISAMFHIDKEWLLDDSRDDMDILDTVPEDELLEKYGRLKENYREFARRQLDFLLELQEKEEKISESPVD